MENKSPISDLVKALREDEGYRLSWIANIAIQFQDEWEKASEVGGLPRTREQIHRISNDAAISFLNLLCKQD